MSVDKKYLAPYVDEASYIAAWLNRWHPTAPTNPVDIASADEYLAQLPPSSALTALPLGQLRAWALASRPKAPPIAIAMGDVDP